MPRALPPSSPAPGVRLRRALGALSLAGLPLLGGCQWLGIESPETVGAAKQADGQAVGSACRHAGRAIEDCFTLNAKAPRAAVLAGWREMDEYMRENKLEAIAPTVPRPGARGPATAEAPTAPEEAAPAESGKPAGKPPAHHS